MSNKYSFFLCLLALLILVSSCSSMVGDSAATENLVSADIESVSDYSTAYFAGGCFWCIESAFEEVDGVIEVISGYSGGVEVNPSYKQVSSGSTGHTEAVQVIYDPLKIGYEELVHVLLLQIDPTDATGSFVDRGNQYRSAIFYSNNAEWELAQKAVADLESLELYGDAEFAVEINLFETFYFFK